MSEPKSNYYLGNQNLKKAGVPIQYDKEKVEEFLRCSEDIEYFIRKYIKIINIDKGLINFDPYAYQLRMAETVLANRFSIFKLPRQAGKALDIETDILTPDGFKKLKDIVVGDTIYGPDGKETIVTFVTEVMDNHDCYLVTFDNGDTIVADAEHLWEVGSSNWVTDKRKVLTTEQLIPFVSHTNKPFIDFTNTVEFAEKQLPIEPYFLGVWLGDGDSKSPRVTMHVDDYNFFKMQYGDHKYFVDKRNDNVIRFKLIDSQTTLKNMNLYGNKHIPNDYMLGSRSQRISLLQGLMDTDGSVDKENGSCEFYQKNEELIDQIRTLLSSLGIKSRKRRKMVNDVWYWTISFMPNIFVFRLERKRKWQKIGYHPKNKRLYIHKIEKTDSVPVRCLQVDNSSHLFLAGTTLVPTHNTTIIAAICLHHALFNKNYSIAVLAHKHSQAREILARIQLAYEWLPKWLQQGIVKWNEGTLELENGSSIITAATTTGSLRGGSYNLIYLDEFAFVPSNMQEEFFTSVYPVISSGQTSKVVITSTPNGLNMFYKLWVDSEEGNNSYKRVEVFWSDVPGRDEKWKLETIRNTSERQFRQEFECVTGDTRVDVMDERGVCYRLTIKQLYEVLNCEPSADLD